MLFSRKTILTTGQKPLYAASRVINASSASASSVFAKCWVHSTNKTSALIRTVRNRAYSTRASNEGPSGGGLNGKGTVALPFYRKLMHAWTQTPTKWYPLPLAVGALLLVAIQYRRKAKRASKEVHVDEHGMEVIRLKGPWQVHVIGALPLRNMSRLWGYVNSLELPVWFRPIGFRLYAFAFGCNLDEIDPPDLTAYPSLGAFFYRKLRPGARPVEPAALVSPADGTVLHFGTVQGTRVEQVKGITYSLDALLGVERPGSPVSVIATTAHEHHRDMSIVDDREFANVNGIDYSLDQLLGAPSGTTTPTEAPSEGEPGAPPKKFGDRVDASVEGEESLKDKLVHDASVALQVGVTPSMETGRRSTFSRNVIVKPGNALFFSVIYLAPGDYHRFHSPTAWVVEKRRHFVGELYSVSPYMAKRLENLFVLNERVALLGRWKHGFFSMVPVGATNVGSIKINFDQVSDLSCFLHLSSFILPLFPNANFQLSISNPRLTPNPLQALRTNVRGPSPPPGTYHEAVYSAASPILNGQPLTPAQEMGGFCLGSTIVLVFEAPADFEFAVEAGQKIKVGQRLGDVPPKIKED
ncbi:putative catalyzes the formation of phosphatidylethanolamine (PtdEtn) from phosphatidylserine (PtdSer) [Lyophyllum shimeji]|uniref:Phosphatidylserine decarboxylase proenzyme 1, mitochondrial n=1 Tax=Lyophyllum shimeji TaxID=47721 RepID=A0A9P3UKL5_LYOSH|nr:putative catalyzes the formation of phosphatidylethanolamine (PtdEtn) from phosphatidylserine (PtdSer) [Lyophyllum shimeji]